MKFVTLAVFFAVILGVQSYPPSAAAGLSPLLGLGLDKLGLLLNPLGVAPIGLGLNGLGLAIGGSNGLGLNHLAGLLNLHKLGLGLRSGDLNGVSDLGISYGLGNGQLLSQGSPIFASPAVASIGHNVDLVGRGGILEHGATYVAKTRGAIHTAPLDGHTDSVSSVNVAPAPGTL